MTNLTRAFARVSEPGELSPHFLRWLGRLLSWEQLTPNPAVVILGEAGTGKTFEFRARAERLRASGHAAFFLPVEGVVERGVAQSIDVRLVPSFESWRGGPGEAWFFLDSVDESKLKGHSFGTALNTFAQEIGLAALSRCHVVISCRPSDWSKTDESAVRELSGLLAPAACEPVVVQLAPLDEDHVRALAMHEGVAAPDAFMAELSRADAWFLVERPLDVGWVARYWLTRHRLGIRREVLDDAINERLAERHDRRTHLPRAAARRAAARLALAAVVTRCSAFLLPGESDARATDALDPRAFLRDLTNDEIRDLLARGLFDEATYGRVRIHHRSVQDYLAAEELVSMRAASLSEWDLHALFFRKVREHIVVPTHLAGAAAWLAATEPGMRRELLDHAPEHLLDGGDPASLSADERRVALRAYARRFGDRESVFHHLDHAGLRRFATAEMGETIHDLLRGARPHLALTLLRMVEEGRLETLSRDALRLAKSGRSTPRIRAAAIRAVARAGTETERAQLSTLIDAPAGRNPDLLHELLRALFPQHISAFDTARALAAVDRDRRVVLSIDVLAPELVRRVDRAGRLELLEAMTSVAAEAGSTHLLTEKVHFCEQMAEVAAAVMDDGAHHPELLFNALELLQPLLEAADGIHGERLRDALGRHPEVRREIFWRRAGAAESRKTHRALEIFPFELTAADGPWLEDDALRRPDVRDRLLAFDCLARVLSDGSDGHVALERVASRCPDGALRKRLARRANVRLVDAPVSLRRLALRMEAMKRRRQRQHDEDFAALRGLLDGIRAGTHFSALLKIYESADRAGNAFSDVSLDRVREMYDAEIAEAGALGMRALWKSCEPPCIEARAKLSTPASCILGLVGLALDAGAGVDIAGLDLACVDRAITLAAYELNDFPAWFSSIAARHPQRVAQKFAPALRRDFDALPAGTPHIDFLLSKVASGPPTVRTAVAPLLREWILEQDPGTVSALEHALEVLAPTSAFHATEIAALARKRVTAADPARFAVWWCAWLASAPTEAVSFLGALVESGSISTQAVEEVCARLWLEGEAERNRGGPEHLRGNRSALAALAPIVFAQVRPSDDIERAGAYSPGPRDHAQDFRRSLIGWLADVPGDETLDCLDALARHPALRSERDWIRHLVDVGNTAIATNQGLEHAAAVDFIDKRIIQPGTTSDLFDLITARLADIANDLRHGEFSVRRIYNPRERPALEEDVQNLLANQLEQRRRAQYSVAREPEVQRKKKPDIRLYSPRCKGPVTIEIKIAEQWTARQLEKALSSQLVGTYMRASGSDHGILVVCSSGPSKRWRTGSSLGDFAGLLRHLADCATVVARSTPSVTRLSVIGIDFH